MSHVLQCASFVPRNTRSLSIYLLRLITLSSMYFEISEHRQSQDVPQRCAQFYVLSPFHIFILWIIGQCGTAARNISYILLLDVLPTNRTILLKSCAFLLFTPIFFALFRFWVLVLFVGWNYTICFGCTWYYFIWLASRKQNFENWIKFKLCIEWFRH